MEGKAKGRSTVRHRQKDTNELESSVEIKSRRFSSTLDQQNAVKKAELELKEACEGAVNYLKEGWVKYGIRQDNLIEQFPDKEIRNPHRRKIDRKITKEQKDFNSLIESVIEKIKNKANNEDLVTSFQSGLPDLSIKQNRYGLNEKTLHLLQ